MVKWCNKKHFHIIKMKRWIKYGEMVQIIHTSSHGEMLKQNSGYILLVKWQNGKTVILTFVSPLFRDPLQWWVLSPQPGYISCCIRRLVSWRFRVDRLFSHKTLQRPSMPYPPAAFDRYISYLPSLCHHHHRGGSSPFVTSSFSPLLAVHILAIYYIISVLL